MLCVSIHYCNDYSLRNLFCHIHMLKTEFGQNITCGMIPFIVLCICPYMWHYWNDRKDHWLTGLPETKQGEGSGYGYKRSIWRSLLMMGMLHILTTSVSVSWLWYCTRVSWDVTIGENQVKEGCMRSLLFLIITYEPQNKAFNNKKKMSWEDFLVEKNWQWKPCMCLSRQTNMGGKLSQPLTFYKMCMTPRGEKLNQLRSEWGKIINTFISIKTHQTGVLQVPVLHILWNGLFTWWFFFLLFFGKEKKVNEQILYIDGGPSRKKYGDDKCEWNVICWPR